MAAYTGTPRTWTAGETVTAALMNSDVRDPLAALAGAWTSYTPTLGGFTAGNGVPTGAYIRVGKLVVFRAKFVFGTTSAGASAIPLLSLPVTRGGSGFYTGFTGFFYDDFTGDIYDAFAYSNDTSNVALAIKGTNGLRVTPTASTPFTSTWSTSDYLTAAGVYEAA